MAVTLSLRTRYDAFVRDMAIKPAELDFSVFVDLVAKLKTAGGNTKNINVALREDWPLAKVLAVKYAEVVDGQAEGFMPKIQWQGKKTHTTAEPDIAEKLAEFNAASAHAARGNPFAGLAQFVIDKNVQGGLMRKRN